MLCKCYWIVLYIVHVTAFCLGGPFFSRHGVDALKKKDLWIILLCIMCVFHGSKNWSTGYCNYEKGDIFIGPQCITIILYKLLYIWI